MHVLHLIKGLGRGGAENLLLATAEERPRQHDVQYSFAYFLTWKDALAAPIRETGAAVRCLRARSAGGIIGRIPALAAHLRQRRIDLVHCHLPLAGVAGRLAGALARVPVVYTEHNLMERYHGLTRRANLWTWGLQRAVVAVSAEVAGSIVRHAGDRVPVRVVRNGIPVERMLRDEEGARRLRMRLGISPEAPVVGQIAVFRRQKRLDLWLRAAALIRELRPEARFLLVGDGPLRRDVENLARELELADALFLPGLQEDVKPFLSAMDLLMFSSDFEGLPLVLLEAMALALPVVATEVGGIPEAVVPGGTGLLVAPGDPAALAAAAHELLVDGARRSTMGAAARERAGDLFGTDRMLDELEGLYREVLRR